MGEKRIKELYSIRVVGRSESREPWEKAIWESTTKC